MATSDDSPPGSGGPRLPGSGRGHLDQGEAEKTAAPKAATEKKLRTVLSGDLTIALHRTAVNLLAPLGDARAEADDVMQDLTYRLLPNLDFLLHLSADERRARIFRRLINLCLDRLRHYRASRRIFDFDKKIDWGQQADELDTTGFSSGTKYIDELDPIDMARGSRISDQVLSEMRDLDRLVFVLFEIEGLSAPKISAILDLPEGTVRSTLARARQVFFKATRKRLGFSSGGQG